jgi:hypothetical protein
MASRFAVKKAVEKVGTRRRKWSAEPVATVGRRQGSEPATGGRR